MLLSFEDTIILNYSESVERSILQSLQQTFEKINK